MNLLLICFKLVGQVLGDDGSMLPTFDCDANWPVQRYE